MNKYAKELYLNIIKNKLVEFDDIFLRDFFGPILKPPAGYAHPTNMWVHEEVTKILDHKFDRYKNIEVSYKEKIIIKEDLNGMTDEEIEVLLKYYREGLV